MEFTSIFFKTNESILEIHLKDTNKRTKTYQACLNIFHCERKYLNDFVVKIRISKRINIRIGKNSFLILTCAIGAINPAVKDCA
jgi:hypothetical protein